MTPIRRLMHAFRTPALAVAVGLTAACNLQYHAETGPGPRGPHGGPAVGRATSSDRAAHAQVDAFVAAFEGNDLAGALATLEKQPAGFGDAGPLVLVGTRVGDERLAGALKNYLAAHPLEGRQGDVFAQIYAYLKHVKRTEGLCPAIAAAVAGGNFLVASVWAAGEQKCNLERPLLVHAFVADNPNIRSGAVYTAGELGYKDLLRKVEILRVNDPYFDTSCGCYPVRERAAMAMNKLLLVD